MATIWKYYKRDIMDKQRIQSIEAKAKIFKALSHPSRVFIIEELIKSERCICEFAELLGVDKSTISKHFTVLKNAEIISTRKEGTSVYCSLRLTCIKNFFNCTDEILGLTNKSKDESTVCNYLIS